MTKSSYDLLDSGNARKLERFGSFLLERPCSGAVWRPSLSQDKWHEADAVLIRDPDSQWFFRHPLPESWTIELMGITFKLKTTDFGHLGIFPEQLVCWKFIDNAIVKARKQGYQTIKVLNLFAYSGGSTLTASRAGAEVCHLDASKGMVSWAKENAELNNLDTLSIRWIVDDAMKFLKREIRRNSYYDAIILDPPSFGRGRQGEVFKIEDDLIPLLDLCRQALSKNPLFILFSCHTPGYTPLVMHHLLRQTVKDFPGTVEAAEMTLEGHSNTFSLPSGTYAIWSYER